MIQKLMHKYALSRRGATDMMKACGACVLSNIALMMPIGLLYTMASRLIAGRDIAADTPFYIAAVVAFLALIALTTYIQYNATFLATYEESGKRRTSLAETLRKLPLSFFGKRDLSDLTATIMSDCAKIETVSSHHIAQLAGSLLSTTLVGASLLFIDWRMALAALWVYVVLPVESLVRSFRKVRQRSSHAVKLSVNSLRVR